jgi:hypothetical protein
VQGAVAVVVSGSEELEGTDSQSFALQRTSLDAGSPTELSEDDERPRGESARSPALWTRVRVVQIQL